jgi:hypothetical protein
MNMVAIVNTYTILHADHLADLRVNEKIIFKWIKKFWCEGEA